MNAYLSEKEIIREESYSISYRYIFEGLNEKKNTKGFISVAINAYVIQDWTRLERKDSPVPLYLCGIAWVTPLPLGA